LKRTIAKAQWSSTKNISIKKIRRAYTRGKRIDRRLTARIEGDFIVFMIGMRINRFWKLHRWIPVVAAKPKML
jgi:hypothetical protein